MYSEQLQIVNILENIHLLIFRPRYPLKLPSLTISKRLLLSFPRLNNKHTVAVFLETLTCNFADFLDPKNPKV